MARSSSGASSSNEIKRLLARWARPERRRFAVFLGAGASKAFGYPLTSDLLHKVVDWLARDNRRFLAAFTGDPRGTGRRNRLLLREYLEKLLPGERVRGRNLPLVTTLLSLLDFSLATGQSVLPSASPERTRQARRLLERGILEVINDEEAYNDDGHRSLDLFCRLLADLRRRNRPHPMPVITTNYDMAADEAVFTCAKIPGRVYWDEDVIAQRIDFGFSWLHPDAERVEYSRPRRPQFQLLKLHGSTNWLCCPLCDNVYVDPWGPIWKQAYKSSADRLNTCDCSATRLDAQIVSPSFVREIRAANLLGVWKQALDSLRAASEWLIIGYSFPDEDLAIRALFTRAYNSRTRAPLITVIQKDESARNRYEAFFEPDKLAYVAGGLEPFLDAWTSPRGGRQRPRRDAHRSGRA